MFLPDLLGVGMEDRSDKFLPKSQWAGIARLLREVDISFDTVRCGQIHKAIQDFKGCTRQLLGVAGWLTGLEHRWLLVRTHVCMLKDVVNEAVNKGFKGNHHLSLTLCLLVHQDQWSGLLVDLTHYEEFLVEWDFFPIEHRNEVLQFIWHLVLCWWVHWGTSTVHGWLML